MRRALELDEERQAMATLVKLTGAFEGIASLHIAQIRDQVLASQQFFGDLWHIYKQLRVDQMFRFGRLQTGAKPVNKELMILITSNGSFSGDIDHRLVEAALGQYDPAKSDVVVIGRHGALLLGQKGVDYSRSFAAPENDLRINTAPLVEAVKRYKSTVVYYEQYQSLMSQQVSKIQLSEAVIARGSRVGEDRGQIIDESTYIFEPSVHAVVGHLESSMMQISLSEVILESKLAQYASRFRAMSLAEERASDALGDINLHLSRARRYEKDERLKEIINGLRGVKT